RPKSRRFTRLSARQSTAWRLALITLSIALSASPQRSTRSRTTRPTRLPRARLRSLLSTLLRSARAESNPGKTRETPMLLAFLLCPLLTLGALVALLCAVPYLVGRLEHGSVDGPAMYQAWDDLELELDVAAGWDVLLAVRPCRPVRVRRPKLTVRNCLDGMRHASVASVRYSLFGNGRATRAIARNVWAGKGCATTGPPPQVPGIAGEFGEDPPTPL